MQINTKFRDSSGFTIIEVLIVLAIAGLILIFVLLAAPALQRSSRNTQRKHDAASAGSAVAHFISDNGGTVPVSLGKNATITNVDFCGSGGGATGGSTVCSGNLQTAKLGYYQDSKVTIQAAGASVVTPAVTISTIAVVTGEDCNDNNTAGGKLNSRTAAIFYAVETGSNSSATECVEQ
jgi:prepilin-type N-terminal cleavage/methylation domain-containing protein